MRFFAFRRFVLAFFAVIALAAPVVPAVAQSDDAPAPWQTVITHQIQAFRAGDAPEAFYDAGRMFHAAFPDAFAFFTAIIGSGYAPIMESTSHSFGEFRMTEDKGVVQVVRLVGKSQELYEAWYQLKEEDGEWRVQGVMLQKAAGIGV
jgi:hypothetical protein